MELKKFKKNSKYKKTLLALGIAGMCLGGGIILSKSYALYETKKEYNVIKGEVPYFVYPDIKLAIKVDGEEQDQFPSEHDNYVVETECNNDATIEWDYKTWSPIIKNVTEKTRCSINYVTNNNLQTLGNILAINNLNSTDTLLTEENINKLVENNYAMTYLAKSPTIVDSLQRSSQYNETIKKKILESAAISEDMKYEAGLPCYLIKNGEVFEMTGGFVPRSLYAYKEGGTSLRENFRFENLEIIAGDADSIGIVSLKNKIKLNKYSKISFTYAASSNEDSKKLTGNLLVVTNKNTFNARNYAGILNADNQVLFSHSLNADSQIVTEEKELQNKDDSFIIIELQHGSEISGNAFYLRLHSLALY